MRIETILMLSAAINVIVLIVFFVMANNVAKIKKSLDNSLLRLVQDADMEKYAGNKEKAKELYLKAKYRIEVLNEKNYGSDGKVIPGLSMGYINNKIDEVSK